MKKYLLVLAVLLLFPSGAGTDLGELIPVEVVAIEESGGRVTVATDTGHRGTGTNFREASEDLRRSAPGTICLETADYILLWGSLEPEQLLEELRPSAEICYGRADPAKAVPWLRTHSPGCTLKDVRAGRRALPELREEEGGYHYEEGLDSGDSAGAPAPDRLRLLLDHSGGNGGGLRNSESRGGEIWSGKPQMAG